MSIVIYCALMLFFQPDFPFVFQLISFIIFALKRQLFNVVHEFYCNFSNRVMLLSAPATIFNVIDKYLPSKHLNRYFYELLFRHMHSIRLIPALMFPLTYTLRLTKDYESRRTTLHHIRPSQFDSFLQGLGVDVQEVIWIRTPLFRFLRNLFTHHSNKAKRR